MGTLSDIFAFEGTGLGSTAVTFCLVTGVCIAVIFMSVSGILSGRIVRRYSKQKIYTPEESLTLTETGLGTRRIYRFLLRERSSLRKYIKISNEAECVSKGKPDLRTAKLYLPAEKEAKALTLYGEREPNPVLIVIALALFIAVAAAVLALLPALLSAASHLFE